MNILVLNAGSSSLKCCLYDIRSDPPLTASTPLWNAHVEWASGTKNRIIANIHGKGKSRQQTLSGLSREDVLRELFQSLTDGDAQAINDLSDIDIVGHRVVHGGAKYSHSTFVDEEVRSTIAELGALAPTHNPIQLEGINIIRAVLGKVPQAAVFDTAFHQTIPLDGHMYPLPYEWYDLGVRRYGFHGISHRYCAERAAQILDRPLSSMNILSCHLGNGCSLTAIRGGVSVGTTMGFTPLEGLMMGTRSGSVDPGILLYMMREHKLSTQQVDDLLNKESGLKGVSGLSSDMRVVLQAAEKGHERARLALDLFIHRLRAAIGSMIAVLEGLDVLVFTAGIGEHSALIRERACRGFGYLRLELDIEKNSLSPVDADIAATESNVRVLVLHTEEDWAIARDCWDLMHGKNEGGTVLSRTAASEPWTRP